MKKYPTLAQAVSDVARHPDRDQVRCVLKCVQAGKVFYCISRFTLQDVKSIRRHRFGDFLDGIQISLACDFDDVPAQVAADPKKVSLCEEARQTLTTTDTGDGAHRAAQKCIDILMDGGSCADAKRALAERVEDLQWI